jgi:hypothetical protein
MTHNIHTGSKPRSGYSDEASFLAGRAIQSHQTKLAIAAVSLEFGVTELDLKSPKNQSRHIRFVRQVAMYLVHVVYELNHTHIARLFAKDRSTVSHACKVVEDSRDDGVFDLKLIRLENFLRQAPQPAISARMGESFQEGVAA